MPADQVTEAEAHRIGVLLHEVAQDLAQRLRRAGIR
jgi:hypothetical protein